MYILRKSTCPHKKEKYLRKQTGATIKIIGTHTSIVVPVGTHVRFIVTPNDVILLGLEYNS